MHYNLNGVGTKDNKTLGLPDSVDPYLGVEIYHPGDEVALFAAPAASITTEADDLAPVNLRQLFELLASKFAPLTILTFGPSQGVTRYYLALVCVMTIHGYKLAAGSAATVNWSNGPATIPKVGKLFAQDELHRSFCCEHDPLLTPTPENKVLWHALKTKPEPRQIGP